MDGCEKAIEMAKVNRRGLVDAIRSQDLSAVRTLLVSNPELARVPGAIVEAARLGWMKGLELLVRHGADLDSSVRGYRPLHALIQEVPHGDSREATEVRRGCLKWMLSKGADPEQLGAFPPLRALMTAVFVGEPAYVTELRKAGAVVDGFVAAGMGEVQRVKRLLQSDPSFALARDPGGLTALHCCAGSRMGKKNRKTRENLVLIARALLEGGADVGARVRGWGHELDAVYFAVSSGQGELFELLLNHGADPTGALTPAVWRNNIQLAQLALNRGGRIDDAVDEGKPLLNQLIRWGQMKQSFWLLEHGASPNIVDQQGWTAVHQAASRGNESIMKAVLDSGGNPTAKDLQGSTPLDIALERGRPKIVSLLKARTSQRSSSAKR
jgi:ankyrin repeat protein